MARSPTFPAVTCARLVLLVLRLAMCSLWLSEGPRAGRYGPEEQLCSWLVLLVMIHLALCSLLFHQARMLGIMAGMNQKGFFKVVPRPIPMVFAAQADHGDSPVAGRSSSRRGAEAVSHGPDCSPDHIHSSVADYGDRRPCCAGRAGFHPGRGAEVFSHGPDCCRTIEFPQFVDKVDDVPVVSRAGVEETFDSCSSLRTSMVINIPVLAQRLIHMVFDH